MEFIEARSSFILEIRYTEEKKQLRIRIGETFYTYHEVTRQKVARLKNAVSRGKYYCAKIKEIGRAHV